MKSNIAASIAKPGMIYLPLSGTAAYIKAVSIDQGVVTITVKSRDGEKSLQFHHLDRIYVNPNGVSFW